MVLNGHVGRTGWMRVWGAILTVSMTVASNVGEKGSVL